MGIYTEHWKRYLRSSARSLLRAFLWIGLGLPAIAFVGYALSSTTDLAIPIEIALLVLWLVGFTRMAIRQSRVTCPRCAEIYTRGKGLRDCPRCGLRMLDEGPPSEGAS